MGWVYKRTTRRLKGVVWPTFSAYPNTAVSILRNMSLGPVVCAENCPERHPSVRLLVARQDGLGSIPHRLYDGRFAADFWFLDVLGSSRHADVGPPNVWNVKLTSHFLMD